MAPVLKNRKILVVDDEQAMLSIVKEVLKKAGADPVTLTNPELTRAAVYKARFDAVILDRHMPQKDGNEVLKELKADPVTQKIPVIMLTGEKDMKEVQASLKLGAVGYIVKPFTPKNFLSQLSKILGNQMGVNLGFK